MKVPKYCIITMAGLGSRFKKAGYLSEKFQIEVKGKTLFEWSMLSLKSAFKKSHFLFITLSDCNAKDFIKDKASNLGISNFSVIELPKLTNGQAQTALAASAIVNKNDSILIFNIDTYITSDVLINSIDYNNDGFIPCFYGKGDHWSFVKGENNIAKQVVEKERISENCSIGAYYFKYFSDFMYAYCNTNESNGAECFIAPLYNILIKNNKKIGYSIISQDKVKVLGTPSELEVFKNEETDFIN